MDCRVCPRLAKRGESARGRKSVLKVPAGNGEITLASGQVGRVEVVLIYEKRSPSGLFRRAYLSKIIHFLMCGMCRDFYCKRERRLLYGCHKSIRRAGSCSQPFRWTTNDQPQITPQHGTVVEGRRRRCRLSPH